MPLNVARRALFSPRTRPYAVSTSTNSVSSGSANAHCGSAAAPTMAIELWESQPRRVGLGEERSDDMRSNHEVTILPGRLCRKVTTELAVLAPCCGTCYGSYCGTKSCKRYIICRGRAVMREKIKQAPPAECPDSASVLAQMDRILSTPFFQHSKRYPAFLRYVVEQTLRGANDELKERTLGIAVFGRSPDYDTSADPVVRNTASEVRKRLEEYYSGPGHEGELRISLPAGAYVPEFRQSMGNVLPVSVEPTAMTVLTRLRRRRTLVFGASVLAGLGLLGAIQLSARKPAIQLFWGPILQSPGPVLVVTDTLVTLRDKPQSDSGSSSRPVRDLIDPKT